MASTLSNEPVAGQYSFLIRSVSSSQVQKCSSDSLPQRYAELPAHIIEIVSQVMGCCAEIQFPAKHRGIKR